MKLQGKIAIIAGAVGGIGQATAEALAHEGAGIAISCSIDRDGAEAC